RSAASPARSSASEDPPGAHSRTWWRHTPRPPGVRPEDSAPQHSKKLAPTIRPCDRASDAPRRLRNVIRKACPALLKRVLQSPAPCVPWSRSRLSEIEATAIPKNPDQHSREGDDDQQTSNICDPSCD